MTQPNNNLIKIEFNVKYVFVFKALQINAYKLYLCFFFFKTNSSNKNQFSFLFKTQTKLVSCVVIVRMDDTHKNIQINILKLNAMWILYM